MTSSSVALPQRALEVGVATTAAASVSKTVPLHPDRLQACMCGCNSQTQFQQMVMSATFADPETNFFTVVGLFARSRKNAELTSAIKNSPLFQGKPLDLYLLFHIVLRNRAADWRLHWRQVLLILGLQSSKEQARELKRLYGILLKELDSWVRSSDRKPLMVPPPTPPAVTKSPLSIKVTVPLKLPQQAPILPQVVVEEPIQLPQKREAPIVEPPPIKTPKLEDYTQEFGLKGKNQPLFKVERPSNAKTLSLIKKQRVQDKDRLKELHSRFIPNPMTTEFRLLPPSVLGFDTDFKSGYAPIQMQSEQENEPKVHFIRRKQSAINIKRCCGVTYVLPTESKQIGVRENLPPLPPLAFQVGTLERCRMSEEEEKETLSVAKAIIKHIFDGSGCVSMVVLDGVEEEDIKNYILTKEPCKEVLGLQDITELWRFLYSGSFVALHFLADNDQLLFPALPEEIKGSDVIVGFTTRKGLCGTKSVKKCLEMEACEGDTLNTYANSIKLELYITKELWTKATPRVRKLLSAFISAFESEIRKLLTRWNNLTKEAFDTRLTRPGLQVYSYLNPCTCQCGGSPSLPTEKWDFSVVELKRTRNVACCSVCRNYRVETNYYAGRCAEKVLASKNPPNLYYLINTRDSFSYDLAAKQTNVEKDGRNFTKVELFFNKEDLPGSYKDAEKFTEGDYVRAGVTGYLDVFTPQELDELEDLCMQTEEAMKKGQFLEDTAQASYGAGNSLKRTKFFFGSRYMWTACQLAERQSCVAAGVRADVSPTPQWMITRILDPLVAAGVIEPGFINSIAMNIYHDGTEGLAQHFDDATRFHQPVYTLKLGSDSRLSFGSQFYGFCNGAFCVPCPRGAISVMEECSYAANRAKHCVRPCDLTGRSITMILRQIHPRIMVQPM